MIEALLKIDVDAPIPQRPGDFVPRNHLPRTRDQQRQELESLGAQSDEAPGLPQFRGRRIELEHSEAIPGRGAHNCACLNQVSADALSRHRFSRSFSATLPSNLSYTLRQVALEKSSRDHGIETSFPVPSPASIEWLTYTPRSLP